MSSVLDLLDSGRSPDDDRPSSGDFVDDQTEQPFEKRRLLWEDVCEHVPPAERDEVRLVLGEAVLQRNEEVATEVDALAMIWGDLRRQGAHKKEVRRPPLPELPARRLLLTEIAALVDAIHESGKDVRKVSRLRSQKDLDVLRYVTREAAHSSSSMAEGARPDGTSRSASAMSERTASDGSSSVAAAVIESAKPHLSAFAIDRVVGSLREALDSEYELLLADVAYLQTCIDGEHKRVRRLNGDGPDGCGGGGGGEEEEEEEEYVPSVRELRELGQRIERGVSEEQEREKRIAKLKHLPRSLQRRQRRMEEVAAAQQPSTPPPPVAHTPLKRPTTPLRMSTRGSLVDRFRSEVRKGKRVKKPP